MSPSGQGPQQIIRKEMHEAEQIGFSAKGILSQYSLTFPKHADNSEFSSSIHKDDKSSEFLTD